MTEITPALGLSAYFLGRRIAGQRRKPERVPVAYLYNGVRLPPLPEWDRVAYPYAYIYNPGEKYAVRFTENPFVVKDISGVMEAAGQYCYSYYNADEGEWGKVTDGLYEDPSSIKAFHVWANYDVLDYDGTVCFATNDPIPVYE